MTPRRYIYFALLMVLGYFAGTHLSHGNWKVALPLTLAAIIVVVLRREIQGTAKKRTP